MPKRGGRMTHRVVFQWGDHKPVREAESSLENAARHASNILRSGAIRGTSVVVTVLEVADDRTETLLGTFTPADLPEDDEDGNARAYGDSDRILSLLKGEAKPGDVDTMVDVQDVDDTEAEPVETSGWVSRIVYAEALTVHTTECATVKRGRNLREVTRDEAVRLISLGPHYRACASCSREDERVVKPGPSTFTAGGSLIGYGRVSTRDQDTQLQRDALNEAGVIRIFEEKQSGKSTKGREALAAALDYARSGDTLAVWKLDRLGRSALDVLTIANDLHARGIGLRVLTGHLAGSYSPTGEGKFFFTVMAAFAELERDMIQERVMAGLEAARAQGRTGGRPRAVDADKLVQLGALCEAGKTVAEAAAIVGVSRASAYRALAAGQEAA